MRATIPCPVCRAALPMDAVRCDACDTDFSSQTISTGELPTLVRLRATEPLDAQELIDDLVGTLSPRFQGLKRLGRGGMGLVFVARDPLLKRDVAIKVLAPEYREDEGARERFQREAQAAAAVAHPNVVAIFQVGELEKTRIPYFVMQFIEGNTLEHAFPRGTTASEAAARRTIAEIAAALAAAHARALVHRDIKPSNVMLDPHTGRAVVLDFGISASVVKVPSDERLTATGMYIGTPRYMSPEQAGGEELTPKSDLYSLGCLGYELLTGRPVFDEKNAMALVVSHMRDLPKPIAELRPGVDRELAALVMRCLEKDPEKRPSAQELAQRLAPGGGALLEWPAPGIEALQGGMEPVNRALLLGSALVTATLLGLVGAGRHLPSVQDSGLVPLLLLPGLFGLLVLGVTARRSWVLGRAATTAVRAGYPWMTIAETIADLGGDTGALITGSQRFAELDAAQRARFRMRRVASVALCFAAGVFPLVAFWLLVVIAGHWRISYRWTPAVMLPSLVALWVAFRLRADEWRAAPPLPVSSTEASGAGMERMASPWLSSLDEAAHGQHVSSGPPRDRRIAAAGVAFVGLTVLVTFATLVSVETVSSAGAVWTQWAVPKFNGTADKVRATAIVRHLRLPADSTMTAMEAGILFRELLGPRDPVGSVRFQPTTLAPPPWRGQKPPAAGVLAVGPKSWEGPAPDKVLEAAGRGLDVDDVRYLEMVAKAPQWTAWDRLARAPGLDVLGASIVWPLAPTVTWYQVPIPRFAIIKEYGYASVSRAAYFLSRHQPDSAEYALRSTIAIGLLISEHGNTLIEALIGAVLTGIGRDGLIRLYTVSGRPEGPVLRSRYDSAVVAAEARRDAEVVAKAATSGGTFTLPEIRRQSYAQVMDRSQLRAVRLEFLAVLVTSSCSNVREIVFGPDRDVRNAIEDVQRTLVRFPSDSVSIALIASRVSPRAHMSLPFRLQAIRGVARVASVLLQNPRIQGCVDFTLAMQEE